MRAIGNFIWFIFGGIIMGLGWFFYSLICFVTIIGIPWGRACFVMGKFSFFPFGREAINRKELTGASDIGTGAAGLVGNIVWFIFGGVWLAMGHLIAGMFCCLTIIGIPFGLQHFKLAGIALAPIGKTIVTKEAAQAARMANAQAFVAKARS